MEETKNLAEMGKDISGKLFDAITLLETLEEIVDGSRKEATLLSITKQNIKLAFYEIEECRKMIYILD